MRDPRRFTGAERAEIWDRVAGGESIPRIAASFDRYPGAVRSLLLQSGGVRPGIRTRSGRALSMDDREEISRGLAAGESRRVIATRLGRAPSTVSREVKRNGGRSQYRAQAADRRALRKARRPKASKLAQYPRLRRVVEQKTRTQMVTPTDLAVVG